MQVIIKRRVDGPSVPELGTPVAATFDSVTVPLARPSTGPAAISAYQIERATSASGPWTVIANSAGAFGNPPTQYVDGGRSALTAYYYRAKATDTAGRESSYSATVTVTTPANAVAAVINTRFAGLSFVTVNSYPDGIERRFNGTDSVTGQQFGTASPLLWGSQRGTPVVQFLGGTGVDPSGAWTTEFVTNAPGNRPGLRIRRNTAFAAPAQAAFRLFPGVIWSGQSAYYCRKDIFIPAGFPTTTDGFFVFDEVKVNGAGEQEDRVAWSMVRTDFGGASRFGNQLAATWTNGTSRGAWNSSTAVSPAQFSLFGSSFYKLGGLSDNDGSTLPEAGKYVTTEFAVCLQDVQGRVQGNAPQGFAACAVTVGTSTAPAPRGTGTMRCVALGRNMMDAFAASPPSGGGIVFPLNLYSNLPIQGLDFYVTSLELYDYIPDDASSGFDAVR